MWPLGVALFLFFLKADDGKTQLIKAPKPRYGLQHTKHKQQV